MSKVKPGGLDDAVFFLNYQLFRNVSRLDLTRGDILLLLVPRANALTGQDGQQFLSRHLMAHVQQAVHLVAEEPPNQFGIYDGKVPPGLLDAVVCYAGRGLFRIQVS